MSAETYGNAYRSTLLCVDGYENRVLSGRFVNAYYKDGVSFVSTIDFLSRMEDMLERMNAPQSFAERRTFRKNEENPPNHFTETDFRPGALATFSLRILFRQNASWQGSLHWREADQSESFRSVLELLLLLDSALT